MLGFGFGLGLVTEFSTITIKRPIRTLLVEKTLVSHVSPLDRALEGLGLGLGLGSGSGLGLGLGLG